ncbi:MAG: strF [Solirubrobacterales bacterium]|nr:strF [Solirubrobacterales bacterium]
MFASCVGTPETYRACALPGLRTVAEPDSLIIEATADRGSIFTAYDEILAAVAAIDDVEALVLLHEDVELLDPRFCATVRARLADERVAVIGAIGATGVTSLAWWEGQGAGHVVESRGTIDFGRHPCPVDTVDGLLMVLSPWAIATLRYGDGHPAGFHGYDAELCFAARAAGREVWVQPLALIHHTKGGYGDAEAYRRADAAFRARWITAAPVPH